MGSGHREPHSTAICIVQDTFVLRHHDYEFYQVNLNWVFLVTYVIATIGYAVFCCAKKMAYTPRAMGWGNKPELEEGTGRAMSNSKMSYATGYLLKIGRDAMFDSPMRGSHSLATIPNRSPLSDRTASPIRLKFGRRSPTSPLQDLWYATEAMMITLAPFDRVYIKFICVALNLNVNSILIVVIH